MRTREVIREAKKLGADAGTSAATWAEIDESNAARILKGFEDCDPAILDSFYWPNLSGEWADSPTPQSLAEEIGIDPEDDRLDSACDAWEESSSRAFENEITRRCRLYLA